MNTFELLSTDVQDCTMDVQGIFHQLINDCYDDLEETLLAILAAGVPMDCISVIHPHLYEDKEYKSFHIVADVRFIKGV